MLFLTIPTAHAHPELLDAIIENCSVPQERIVLIATRPNLDLPRECIIVEDLGPPNIQRWWGLGIEESTKRGATAVAVLNDDLVINKKTLPFLHSELNRTGATIASPTRPDWEPGHYRNSNIFPYTPVIWGCLWMLDTAAALRPDPQYVWWYGDSDLDIRARRDCAGIVTADVYYEHFFPGEGTSNSSSLAAQTVRDGETFESNYRDFLKISRSTAPRKLFVQTQQFPARKNSESDYREDFFHYVARSGDPERDRVVLVEPNNQLHESLKDLWSTWQNVLIVEKHLTIEHEPPHITMYRTSPDVLVQSRQSIFSIEVQRFGPQFELQELPVPTGSLSDLVNEVTPGAKLSVLAFDSRTNSITEMIQTRLMHDEIIAIAAGVDERALFTEASELGLHFTGRPWGQAHSTAAFSYKRGNWSRTVKTLAGHVISKLVDAREGLRSSSTAGDIFRTRVTREFSKADLLDKDHGRSPREISPRRIDTLLNRAAGTTNAPEPNDSEWQVPVDQDSDIHELAIKCFDTHGVWPLSMSIPAHIALNLHPTELVSPIIPGYPYTFHSEADYLAKYAESYFALTHRKAGWDCFRHVEIMASGSVPLMPDASEIPEFSMVHYPKRALAKIAQKISAERGRPSWELRCELRAFFLKHLTTKSMAAYILNTAKIPNDASVLFLDENLPSNPEYISTLTAIGLKENLGSNCVLHFPGDFLYSDSKAATQHFYGRGFGYVKKLDPSLRSSWENSFHRSLTTDSINFTKYDFVVIGSISRNEGLTQMVLEKFPHNQILLLHGEDTPPTLRVLRLLGTSGAQVFTRSVH